MKFRSDVLWEVGWGWRQADCHAPAALACEGHGALLAPQSDDRDSKRDSLEEGELRDHRMEITIRNSPYRREDSMEDR